MAQSFSAQVDGHIARYRERMEAVFKQSAQDVFEQAQTPQPGVRETGGSFEVGKIPVGETGFLRGSFVSGLNGSTALNGADSYVMTIANAELGDTIFGGWTAEYARHVEYGNSRMAGRFFMREAAQRWPQIVRANAARFKT